MPDLGLLFDVDGPLASPVSRTVRIPSILDDLVTLVGAGVPVAFVTGRSHEFVRRELIEPLQAVGLADALRTPGARMFGVFEKGGVWAPITPDGIGRIEVDDSVAVPREVIDLVRDLIDTRFAGSMFFDDTKLAMVSVEQRTDVSSGAYRPQQQRFNGELFDRIVQAGVGIRLGDRESPDAAGRVPFRIDPSIIATDVESVLLDKDRGAARALDYFASLGSLPTVWRSVGDSRSDYLMADQLHGAGLEVAHVDVRPADGILDRPYPVLTEGELVNDEAGARFLRALVDSLGVSARA